MLLVGFAKESLNRGGLSSHRDHHLADEAVEDEGCAVLVYGCYVFGIGDHIEGLAPKGECVGFIRVAEPAP